MVEEKKKDEPKKLRKKQKTILWFSVSIGVLVIVIFLWWFFWGRFISSTDDAYVHGNQVKLTPQISGIVTSINAVNTQLVEAGQILVQLDRTDRMIAFKQSKATLAETIRKVTQEFEKVYALAAQFELVQAELLKKEVIYLDRKEVITTGAISEEEYIEAQANYWATKANLKSVKYELMQVVSKVKNTTIRTHPIVENAKEVLRQSFVNLQRCTLRAPVTGLIAQRRVQVGEAITPDIPLLTIVPIDQMWIEANFKEVDLSKIRLGQQVKMSADIYGKEIIYTGEVIGIGIGSGAVFSALPPQNATGNWIKIVQRIPVKVSLNSDQLKRYPLRLGLSMNVHVDIRNIQGDRIPSKASGRPIYQTDIFQDQIEGAETIINQVMNENITYDLNLSDEIFQLIKSSNHDVELCPR